MKNPILGNLNAHQMMPGNIGQIKQMMQMVRSAGNPGAMVQGMAQNNPQMKQAIDFIKQNGNDPKRAFYALAQQKGVDPDEILRTLQG